jgi:hypothetical protein
MIRFDHDDEKLVELYVAKHLILNVEHAMYDSEYDLKKVTEHKMLNIGC